MSSKGLLNVTEIAAGMGFSRQWVNDRLKLVVPHPSSTANRTWYTLADIIGPLSRDGQSQGGTHVDNLPPREAKEYWLSKKEEANYMERAGELIPVKSFENILAATFKSLSTSLEGIPDTLERRSTLSPEQISTVIKIIDGARQQMSLSLTQDLQDADDEFVQE